MVVSSSLLRHVSMIFVLSLSNGFIVSVLLLSMGVLLLLLVVMIADNNVLWLIVLLVIILLLLICVILGVLALVVDVSTSFIDIVLDS